MEEELRIAHAKALRKRKDERPTSNTCRDGREHGGLNVERRIMMSLSAVVPAYSAEVAAKAG